MSGDVTVGALQRLSHMPTPNLNKDGGNLIAGQDYYNVLFTGGNISNVTLTNCTITLDAINNTPIGATTPSTGAFTTLSAGALTVTGNVTLSGTGNSVGTITSGTWNGGVISGQYGGTGVANTGKTITLGGNLTTTGAFATTFAFSGANTYTFPNVSDTVVTLTATQTLTNKTLTSPTVTGTMTAAAANFSGAVTLPSVNGGQLAGLRNRTINGDFRIDQRNSGASQTITAGTSNLTNAYTVDRFYAACTGANVTGQRVTGTSPDQYAYQFTGATSVSGISFGQRYEATNVYDLASTTATFSVKLANSLLTTVTWTVYYPTSTDTWSGRTSIATGTFTVSSTPATYSTQISLPSNVTTGLEIELTVGAQVSGTWTIAEWQLENGIVATPFERRPIGFELALCQRCYQKSYVQSSVPGSTYTGGAASCIYGTGVASQCLGSVFYPVIMRSSPSIVIYDAAGSANKISYYVSGWNNAGAVGTVTAFDKGFTIGVSSASYINFEYTATAEL